MHKNRNLTPELEEWRVIIEAKAAEYGLDFYRTIFEVLDWKEINEVAARGGFPNRYPHWRFGMEYDQLSKSYEYGLSKIYEMVINNDPCYAYLLHSNHMMDQKLVMAHVFGHCDFFKNNTFFGPTPKNMIDQMANHKVRIQRYIDRLGYERVESFIDACLSIENLIDYQRPFFKGDPYAKKIEEDDSAGDIHRIKVDKEYLEEFINPQAFLELQKQKKVEEDAKKMRVPEHPERDVMGFLLRHAPLSRWEYDILHIIRDEAYYFAPQAQTKIMNEGWASYWHSKIMTTDILDDSEIIDFADHHSGTVATQAGRLNPYKIGIELFRNIEERWNKGQFGKDYDECDDMVEKARWNKDLGLGREKIFEVRKIYNDITFIDTFLTQDFCKEHKLFTYAYNRGHQQYEISSREFDMIKQKLLFQLTNFGQPFIDVVDANFGNRGELMLLHKHEGIDLEADYAKDVLQNLHRIWKRPVVIETKRGENTKILKYDGENHSDHDSHEGL